MTDRFQPGRPPARLRAVGFALLGSALALAAIAAAAYGGLLPVATDVRGWMSAGLAIAAVVDALLGLYFVRASQ